MDLQTSIEQVAGILVREGLSFETHEDGLSYRLWFGRDAVFLHFHPWGDGVRIGVTSPVLHGLDLQDAGFAVVLNRLNDLNREFRFIKWTVEEDRLIAAHDLLGSELRAGELCNVIFAMAGAVNTTADELEPLTGALRYAAVVEANAPDADDDD